MARFSIRQSLASKIFIFLMCGIFIVIRSNYVHNKPRYDETKQTSRKILGSFDSENCKHSTGAVEEFPSDLFTQEQRIRGGVLVHIIVMFYMFGLLAVVCDDYFVLSLYHICSRLNLDRDVAGATFMAIGSSAPTLFIAIVSIFFTESAGDVGLGTVVGSTIFNTLFIVSICSMATTIPMSVTCWPLMRDSFVYTLGTLTLVFTVRDRQVHWYEAIIFVFIYLFYILIMCYNKTLGTFFTNLSDTFCGTCGEIEDDDDTDALLIETNNDLSEGRLKAKAGVDKNKSKDSSAGESYNEKDIILAQFEHKQNSPLDIPAGILPKITWLLGFPVMILFYITIPPCCKQRWSEWFLVTFAMSVMWMGALSYILVWMVCVIGDTFGIPDCIMGMTFLAAGSSIPDVMASVIVARQGMADMALSNAIGSNVFDMLCLGIPWLLKTTIMEPGSFVEIQSQSIMISSLLLIGSIVFTVIAIHLNNWKLDMKIGILFLIVYIVFITIATLLEFLACPCQIEDFLP